MSDAEKEIPDDEAAPGWDAITKALTDLYGAQEPAHYGTVHKWSLGGPDPVDGISVYQVKQPRLHWHMVTYGFTELYGKETDEPKVSGYGFELTFRLARSEQDEEPPTWALNFLQNLARYVFKTGNLFEPGHYIDLHGPIALEHDTSIRAAVFVEDPVLEPIETPNGRVQFVQVVGITEDELRSIKDWNSEGFAAILAESDPLLVTSLKRRSILTDLEKAKKIRQRIEQEGSSTGVTFVSVARWEREGQDARLTLGALAADELLRMTRGRIQHARDFRLCSEDAFILFEPAERADWQINEDSLRVKVSEEAAREILDRLAPKRGIYEIGELPGLTIEVIPSEITDRDGNVVRVVG